MVLSERDCESFRFVSTSRCFIHSVVDRQDPSFRFTCAVHVVCVFHMENKSTLCWLFKSAVHHGRVFVEIVLDFGLAPGLVFNFCPLP